MAELKVVLDPAVIIPTRYASISEIAEAEKIDRGYVGSILRLILLAPDIVEAILSGEAGELSLPRTEAVSAGMERAKGHAANPLQSWW